ncbi:MAG: ATP-binding protein [Candidatus Cloacimonetes bacterium]|nr:ATP-binding protein [Candidatus Cloacimonadota bacterium]
MILKFKIKNHLSFKNEVVLDFVATKKDKHFNFFCEEIGKYKVLKIAMLFGPNASGKSNILYALNTFRNIVLNDKLSKNDTIAHIPFEFDSSTQNAPTFFELEFLVDETKFSYNIEFNDKFILHENLYVYSPKKAKFFSRITNVKTGEINLDLGNKFDIGDIDKRTLTGNTLHNMTILSGYNKTSLQIKVFDIINEWLNYNLRPIVRPDTELKEYIKDKIYNKKIKTNLIEDMLHNADFNVKRAFVHKTEITIELLEGLKEREPILYKKAIEMLEKHPEDNIALDLIFEHLVKNRSKKELFQLPESLESAGTLRYFGLSGVLSEIINRTGVLFIDELESSLHPDLLNHFISTFMLNTKKSQLIFTSHYYPLLEDTDELRKDIVWFTEKREDGSTELYSLKDINIRSSLNYYKAYKTGKFGAKPFVGSAYIPNIESKDE